MQSGTKGLNTIPLQEAWWQYRNQAVSKKQAGMQQATYYEFICSFALRVSVQQCKKKISGTEIKRCRRCLLTNENPTTASEMYTN